MIYPFLLSFITLFLPVKEGKYVDHSGLLQQINNYRIQNNLPELIYLKKRQSETDRFAKGLLKRFGHGAKADFYENIAACRDSVTAFTQWRDSKGHNSNMLEPRLKYVTLSIYQCHDCNLIGYGRDDYYFAVFRGYFKNK